MKISRKQLRNLILEVIKEGDIIKFPPRRLSTAEEEEKRIMDKLKNMPFDGDLDDDNPDYMPDFGWDLDEDDVWFDPPESIVSQKVTFSDPVHTPQHKKIGKVFYPKFSDK